MPNRSQRRIERYKLLKRLGYSPKEARRLRDNSGEKINAEVDRTAQRISRKRTIDRTVSDQQRLRALRDYRQERRSMPAETRALTESRVERVENFNRWSRERDFPPDALREIKAINRRAKRRPNDSYGFRVWYHMYVNRESESQSRRRYNSERYERRDT